jgi:hypothetical protein
MRITRSLVVVATLVVAALLLVSSAQPWVVLGLSSTESSSLELSVLGATLAPAFLGLSLAYVAAMMVALISRAVVRIVCAIIAALVGVAAGIVELVAVVDPVAAGRVTIARVTGISDTEHQRDLITQIALQPWAFVSLIGVLVCLIVALAVLPAGRTWTLNSSRFERRNAAGRRQVGAVPVATRDPHETWDDLSGGGDPTSRSKH